MRNVENYRKYFTKEYMMGPNVLRLLSEIVEDNPQAISKGNVLDLGCGAALSSIFLANETNADTIWAFDLWVSPTDNWKRICENGLEDKIVPIYGDALAMPFAQEYFNTVVSVDTYHYFGCEENIFAQKILPFIKKGGYALIVVPGLKEELQGEMKTIMDEWATDEAYMFKSPMEWKEIIGNHDRIEKIETWEMGCFDLAWNEWFATEHKYALGDKQFFETLIKPYTCFVGIYIKIK